MGKSEKSAKKAAPKRRSSVVKNVVKAKTKKKIPIVSRVDSNDFWKTIFASSEKVHGDTIDNLHQGIPSLDGPDEEWDFSHLEREIRSALKNNPGCDVYAFGGGPESNDFGKMVVPVPTINLILIKHGEEPPPFVAIRDYQRGGEVIQRFQDLKLSWKKVNLTNDGTSSKEDQGAQGFFSLHCTLRSCAMKNKKEKDLFAYEYASLYLMRPSVDWKLNKHNKLQVDHAMFVYESKDLAEPVDEEYKRGSGHTLESFIQDFCERYELDESEHYDAVEEAIRAGFQRARNEKQKNVDLFSNYDPQVLDDIQVIKVYPRNDIVESRRKLPYVNEYYGKANVVV